MDQFLADSLLPTLDLNAVRAMDAEVTLDEIKTAISQFPPKNLPALMGSLLNSIKHFFQALLRCFCVCSNIQNNPQCYLTRFNRAT